MMRARAVLRDVVLLGLAVAMGWWVRGGDLTVMAKQRSSSSSSSSRGGSSGRRFQSGISDDGGWAECGSGALPLDES